MTAPHFATVPDVEPVVELGVGQTFGADVQGGRWDVSHWDQTDAHWSGSEPSWVDVTCDVRAVDSTVGHDRTLDAWDVGTCTVVVDNSDGWADLTIDPLDPDLLDLRPGRAIRWGIRRFVPGSTTPGTPQVPGYLTPNVGTVSTPDPGPLPNEYVFVYRVRGPSGALQHVVAAQYGVEGERSWFLAERTDVVTQMTVTPTGTAAGAVNRFLFAQTAPTGSDETLAVAVQRDNGAGRTVMRGWQMTGTTWAPIGAAADVGATVVPFDSSAAVEIGAFAAALPFDGRIHSVELRTGLDPAAGTVVWRFDANDYPGTGTSYVDPRGRTWTLTNAAAITPKVPGVPDVVVPDKVETTWRFRGYIDAMRASYEGPHAETDTTVLDCVDALGEVARVQLAKLAAPVGDGESVNARLHRILDAIGWRTEWRDLAASNIPVFATEYGAQAADLLGRTADTAAGALFGDYEGRVAFRNRDWQTWVPAAVGYLTPTVGTVSTPDPGPLPAQCVFVFRIDQATWPTAGVQTLAYQWGDPDSSWLIHRNWDAMVGWTKSLTGSGGDVEWQYFASLSQTDNEVALAVQHGTGTIQTWARRAGAWTLLSTVTGTVGTPFDASRTVVVGGAEFPGTRIYSVELRTGLDPKAGTVVWRFDANDYPGTGTSYVDPRGRTWTLTTASAITPKQGGPPDLVLGNTAEATVCPSTIEVAFPRAGTTTRSLVNYEGNDGPPVQRDDAEAQVLYGVETAPERLDLQTDDATQLGILADRLLETRGVATMPRVTGLTLDAGRDEATMLACLDADPQRPTRWRLVIERAGRSILDRMLLVTSVSHSWDAGGWHTSVRLDDATPWAAAGGRWDGAYWDATTWSPGTGLAARLEDLLEALEASA